MNTYFLPFISNVERLVPDVTIRSRVIAATVATAVSRKLLLPSSAVEAPGNHYNTILMGISRTLISALNEGVVFDTRFAMELTRQMWQVRYNAAHPDRVAPALPGEINYDFFCSLSGVELIVSPEDYKFLTDNKVVIFQLATQLAQVLEEM